MPGISAVSPPIREQPDSLQPWLILSIILRKFKSEILDDEK